MMMRRTLDLLWGLLWLGCAAALMIQMTPAHLYFRIGQSMVVVCRVVGDVEDIDWYNPLGEKILPDNPNISVRKVNESISTLKISQANADHTGSYKCVVKTPVREGENSVYLQLFQDITFTNAPSPQVFNEGDNADVVCDVISSPSSEIVWRKGHNIFKGDKDERIKVLKNGHLLIHNIKMPDEGEYHCEARVTSFGVLKSKMINVVINRTRQRPEDSPPRIMEHPSHFTVSKGETAALTCKAEGSPIPTIEWYKDNQRVDNSREDLRSHRLLLPSSAISFLRIMHDSKTKSDRSVYVCVARNYLGEAVSRNATLEVIYPPKIKNQGTVYTWVGNPANISCEVEAHPAPVMSWFKDGLQLSATNNNNMKIYNAPTVSYLEVKPESPNDFGWYSCKAANSLGTDSKEFLLGITGTRQRPEDSPPRIVYHPFNLIVFQGEQAMLNCKTEGSPTPVIEWYKDSQRVDTHRDDPQSHRRLLPSGGLFFLHIVHDSRSKSDEGVYVCVARNYLGEAVSRNATLKVAYPPKIQVQGTVYTWVGNPANISCKVEAHPAPEMSWFKDGLQLSATNNNNMKIYNTPTVSYLEVKPESLNDFGRYSCTASNILGTDTKEFLLAQTGSYQRPQDFPPQIVEQPSDLIVSKGEPAALNCRAEGKPRPLIEWYKDGKSVDMADPTLHRLLLPSGTLFFLRIMHDRRSKSDEGVYMCVARNYLGEAVSRNATLEVIYPPQIQVQGTVYTWVGNPANISCEVKAHPAAVMSWFKDGLQLSDTNNNNMKIYNTATVSYLEVKPESLNDFGRYSCKATNSLGTDTKEIRLVQAGTRQRPEDSLPRIVEHPSDLIVFRGEPATLKCKAQGSPRPVIEWYKNGQLMDSTDPRSHRLLLPTGSLFFLRIVHDRRSKSDEGVYMCVARNYLGEAISRIATLEVTYPPQIQDQGTVYTWVGHPANISCEVEAHPAPVKNWFKDGLQLSDTNNSNMKIYNTATVSYLEIKPESPNDFGTYSCQATNSLGTDTKFFNLVESEVPTRKPCP